MKGGGGAVTAVKKNMRIPHDFNEALFVRTLIIIYILASNGGYRGAVVNLADGEYSRDPLFFPPRRDSATSGFFPLTTPSRGGCVCVRDGLLCVCGFY